MSAMVVFGLLSRQPVSVCRGCRPSPVRRARTSTGLSAKGMRARPPHRNNPSQPGTAAAPKLLQPRETCVEERSQPSSSGDHRGGEKTFTATDSQMLTGLARPLRSSGRAVSEQSVATQGRHVASRSTSPARLMARPQPGERDGSLQR